MIDSLLIIVDLEGCAGVYDLGQKSIKLMNRQMDYILDFLGKNISCKLTVLDFHNSGENLIEIQGKYPNVNFIKHIWNYNDTIKYEAAVLIGFHAPKGIIGGLSHTFRNDIKMIKLGKQIVGEAELLCNWLNKLCIPVSLINGDEYFCSSTSLPINKFALSKGGKDVTEEFQQKYYFELCNVIIESLNQNFYVHKYNTKKVHVELEYSMQREYFPHCYYNRHKNILIFRDTLAFINGLLELCVTLNASMQILAAKLDGLVKYIRFHYNKDQIAQIHDKRFKEILNNIESLKINNEDELYLVKILKTIPMDSTK